MLERDAEIVSQRERLLRRERGTRALQVLLAAPPDQERWPSRQAQDSSDSRRIFSPQGELDLAAAHLRSAAPAKAFDDHSRSR